MADQSAKPVGIARPASLALVPKPRPQFAGVDEDEFRVTASDPKNGTSAKPSFHIHPAYIEQFDKLFHAHRFPYDTPSAIYRHAFKRHARWLKELDEQMGGDTVPSIMHQIEIIERVVLEEERQIDFVESVDRIEAVVKRISGNPGGGRRIKELLVQLWGEIQAMPSGYWRAVYKKMFKKRFSGELAKNPHAANLIPMGEYSDEEFEDDDESGQEPVD